MADLTTGFHWAVGIENTFIAQPHPRTGRTLDEYALAGHYDRWRDDLALVASLGVGVVRYGIPWYRVNPQPGRFDWSWTDEVLAHLVRDLGIDPIVDLMHYGCPLWLERTFLDPAYPELVAEYAARFVERYGALVHAYTPLNEPHINAWWCGRSGAWPPYLRGVRGYVRMALPLARGVQRTIEAIRSGQPDATIVQVEAGGRAITERPELAFAVDQHWANQFLATDLALGRVDEDHALFAWLVEGGAPREELAALPERPSRIDMAGVNFYPNMSCVTIAGTPERIERRWRYGTADDLAITLAAWHERYRVPVMVTETSDTARVARREQWMDAAVAGVRRARESSVPVVGLTWFPVFPHVRWDWRNGRRPLEAYWCDMGLWNTRGAPAGPLGRGETRLVEQFRGYVAGGKAAVGEVTIPRGAKVA